MKEEDLITPASFALHDKSLVVMLIRKAGSSSLQTVLSPFRDTREMLRGKAPVRKLRNKGYTVLAIDRDYEERLRSAWRFFKHIRKDHRGPDAPETFLGLRELPEAVWVAKVMEHPSPEELDEHIRPFELLTTDSEGVIPNLIVPLEEINNRWPKIARRFNLNPEFPHRGSSK